MNAITIWIVFVSILSKVVPQEDTRAKLHFGVDECIQALDDISSGFGRLQSCHFEARLVETFPKVSRKFVSNAHYNRGNKNIFTA